MIAATCIDQRPRCCGAGDRPLRHSEIARHQMAVAASVEIRDTLKARGQTLADVLLSLESLPPRLGPFRRLENTVVRKERHDRVQVVPVECVTDSLHSVSTVAPIKGGLSWNRSGPHCH
jgi:hypothetical protein